MNARSLKALAERWLAEGRVAIDVSVLQHRGSVPREAGTHMLVSASEVAGTIGGGHLELRTIEQARHLLREGYAAVSTATATETATETTSSNTAPIDQHYALGPSLGQCCGGSVTLRHQALSARSLAAWPITPPRFALQLHGAGHVGRAIVKLLADIDCEVTWVDARDDAFRPDSALPAHIQTLVSEAPEAEVATALPGTYFLVMTHSHDLDLHITEAVLRRDDFGWLGLIGSATKLARFMRRLQQRGIEPSRLSRVTCPIGLPNISGKEPAVLAVSIAAQLLVTQPDTHRGKGT